ncbi:MAG: diguanylate cyclase [Lachnospiraceae bacterium]|nr:diguanylate cyclase [Lachnospiraceae bacterium]
MEDYTKDYTFYDLFDIEEIQRIQDEVAYTLHVGSVIVEPDGTPITRPSNFCSFCYDIIRSSSIGCENCKKSDRYLGRPCEGPIISPCLSANLLDAGCSIIVNGKHIASWMLGQVRNADNQSDEDNAEYANALGIDPEIYSREYKKLPSMTIEEFRHIANLIFIITSQLSKLAAHNLQLTEELDRRTVLEEKLQQEHVRLSYSSSHDMLTHVYNRAYFDAKLAELEEAKIHPVSIIVSDVNNLKLTNDVFGHKHGDTLLTTISDIMKKVAKEEYIICRCGGDEFNIILPGAGYNEAKEYCRKIKELCAEDKDNVIPPSISFGIDTKISEKKPLSSVLRAADALMYKNKQADKIASNVLIDIQRVLYDKGFLSEELTERTLILANSFGIFLNLDDDMLKDLNLVTELQDLGMIVVPEELYFKRDPLTSEEFDIIRSHPAISSRLARLYDSTLAVAIPVLHCHENYDGSGYPTRLAGNNIPYLSRVVSIINGYVAMVSQRPYGRELTHEEALYEIRVNENTQFDGEIAERFIEFMQNYTF